MAVTVARGRNGPPLVPAGEPEEAVTAEMSGVNQVPEAMEEIMAAAEPAAVTRPIAVLPAVGAAVPAD